VCVCVCARACVYVCVCAREMVWGRATCLGETVRTHACVYVSVFLCARQHIVLHQLICGLSSSRPHLYKAVNDTHTEAHVENVAFCLAHHLGVGPHEWSLPFHHHPTVVLIEQLVVSLIPGKCTHACMVAVARGGRA
jgi:hypothetical protein